MPSGAEENTTPTRSLLLTLAACLALAAPAAATPMRVHFTGTVTFDDSAGTSLVGEAWTGHYDYDDSSLLLGLAFEVGDSTWSIDTATLDALDGYLHTFDDREGGPARAKLTAPLYPLGTFRGEWFTDVFVGYGAISLDSEFRYFAGEPNQRFLIATLDSLSDPQPIPEPVTLVLLGLGLLGVATQRRFSAASQ